VPEALSPAEVGKEIAEHHAHTADHHDRVIVIFEAVLLSVVALLAAWSGFAAAKWETHALISLGEASTTREKATVAQIRATQTRALDLISFHEAEKAYASKDPIAFRLAVGRLRPGYRPVFNTWLALRPLQNPKAPPDPSYLPQYSVPSAAAGRLYTAQADAQFAEGEHEAVTSDEYVRLTVLLATVLFLVGIGSRFPLRAARNGLVAVAAVVLVIAVIQLLGLPGPPS
jgi:hypothetical protein